MTVFVARSGERKDFAALINRNLRDQMRGIAKAVNADPVRVTGLSIRTIAKHSRAQKRRNIDVVILLRQSKTKSRIGDRELRVAAVDRVAGKFCAIAKIFAVRSTINAVAVGPAEPWNADTVAHGKSFDTSTDLFDASGNLVAQDQWQLWVRQFAIDNVKIGPANRARSHAHEQLSRPRLWLRHIARDERLARLLENHGAHVDLQSSTIMSRRQASAPALRRRRWAWAHLHDAYARCAETALYQERAPGTIRARDK